MYVFRSSKYQRRLYTAMASLLLLALPLPTLAQVISPEEINGLQEQSPIVEDDPLISQTESFDQRGHISSLYGDGFSQYGYVFNPDENTIHVVDTTLHTDTGITIDTTSYGDWPWRGALSPDGGQLYASLRDGDAVLVVDTATNTPEVAIPVGIQPNGIAFSADGMFAFVANHGDDTVSVIDTDALTVTSTIPVGDGPQSIASTPCLDKIYVANRLGGTITVIDASVLTVTQEISELDGAWDIAVSPYGHRVYASSGGEGNGKINVIDTTDDSIVTTWVIGGTFAGLDLSHDGRTLYAVDSENGFTYAIDTFSGQVVTAFDTGTDDSFGESWEVEVFPEVVGSLAYVSSPNGSDVKVIDLDQKTVVETIALSGGPRGLALFPPSTVCSYASLIGLSSMEKGGTPGSTVVYTETLFNLTGVSDSFTLTLSGNTWPTALSLQNTGLVSDGDFVDFDIEADIPIGVEPGTTDVFTITAVSTLSPTTYSDATTITVIALSDQRGYAFVSQRDEIVVIDTLLHVNTGMSIDTASYGSWPWRGALSPDGQRLYVSLRDSSQVLVIDVTNNTPVASVAVGGKPHGIAFAADGLYAFVANRDDDTVSVIDTDTLTITATLPVGDMPQSVASSPCLDKVYVVNMRDSTVSVIDTDAMTVTQEISGFNDPWDIVISPQGHRAYVSNQSDSIGVIDAINDSLVATWEIDGDQLTGLDLSPEGDMLYVVDHERDEVRIVDTSAGQPIATLPTGSKSWEVEIFPMSAGALAYVTGGGGASITVIDTSTHSVMDTILMSGQSRGVALFPPQSECVYDLLLGLSALEEAGPPGDTVVYTGTLFNLTGVADSFSLALSGNQWPSPLCQYLLLQLRHTLDDSTM